MESLGRALSELPLLDRRIQQMKDSDGQFVLIRLVKAHFSITLSDFLKPREREGGEEATLVFWKDIDEQNP